MSSVFRECKQPSQYYTPSEELTMNRSEIDKWDVYYDCVGEVQVRYLCEEEIIKFVLVTL